MQIDAERPVCTRCGLAWPVVMADGRPGWIVAAGAPPGCRHALAIPARVETRSEVLIRWAIKAFEVTGWVAIAVVGLLTIAVLAGWIPGPGRT